MARFGLAAVLALVTAAPGPQSVSAAAGVPSVTDPRYFAGVNVAWLNWGCDFGCSERGAASKSANATLDQAFAQVKTAGIHTVRWWTFEGDASQITRDAAGAPTGLNPSVYADFDAAIALADKYDLAYDFVLFSAQSGIPATWFTNPDQRQKLADVLGPLFDRYKNNPHILAWELLNEPEYDIWGGKLPEAAAQATVKLLASTVHAHTANAVTLGSATLDGALMWNGLGLDFYAPHWYDHMDTGMQCARCVDVATARASGIDAIPLVVGEFQGTPDTDTLQRLKDFATKGYSGAWAWSLFPDQTQDHLHVDLSAYSKFTAGPAATTGQPTAGPPATATWPAPQAGVRLTANWVSPTYVRQGESVTVTQDAVSSEDMTALLDFEVYNSDGQKVLQDSLDNQSLSARQPASFSTTISIPSTLPPGTYTVKTGAFAAGGGTQFDWSDSTGAFVVAVSTLTPARPASTTSDDSTPAVSMPQPDQSDGP